MEVRPGAKRELCLSAHVLSVQGQHAAHDALNTVGCEFAVTGALDRVDDFPGRGVVGADVLKHAHDLAPARLCGARAGIGGMAALGPAVVHGSGVRWHASPPGRNLRGRRFSRVAPKAAIGAAAGAGAGRLFRGRNKRRHRDGTVAPDNARLDTGDSPWLRGSCAFYRARSHRPASPDGSSLNIDAGDLGRGSRRPPRQTSRSTTTQSVDGSSRLQAGSDRRWYAPFWDPWAQRF